MDIYYLRKNKTSDNLFVQAIGCMLGAIILRIFRNNIVFYSLSAALSITAYISFFLYFYKSIYGNYAAKLAEAEKLKATVEKTLNYEVKKRLFEVEKSNEQLLNMAKTDHLTKAYNKIAVLNIIENLINSKKEMVFSLLMFDIDFFKNINDTYGHVTGDICLKTLANIARANIRSMDCIGRYGGDEFIIVLPSLSASEARFVAERFRKRVFEGSDPQFSISLGIASYPDDGSTVKDLISCADKGLYRSKGKGKNAVSHASLF
jgi:diguanylate cyclase (GGDEF)-like protein